MIVDLCTDRGLVACGRGMAHICCVGDCLTDGVVDEGIGRLHKCDERGAVVQAQALQQRLKRHHVQLRYCDVDPFIPSSSGIWLHPTSFSAPSDADSDADSAAHQEAEMNLYFEMQYALLGDASINFAAVPMNHPA